MAVTISLRVNHLFFYTGLLYIKNPDYLKLFLCLHLCRKFKDMKKNLLLGMICFTSTAIVAQKPMDSTQYDVIIIQGNRIEIPFNQASRDIQIITAKEIKQLPVQSVNELLEYVGGIDIRQRGPFGTQADVSMDGGTFEQTLVLLNGIKLINSQTAHNMLNLPIPLSAIDHIEVLRGSAARKYGINALTGAINIVTKKETSSFVDAQVYAGSSFKKQDPSEGDGIYGGGGVQVTGNFGTKKQQHLLSINKTKYNGQRYNSASDNTQLFYNGNVDFNSNNSLQLLGGYSHTSFGANGFYAAPGDKNSEEMVTTALFSLSSKHKLGRFTLSPRISDRYDEDDYRYLKDQPTIGRSTHYTNALMAEINAGVKTTIGEFGLGWESRFETINSSNIGEHNRNNHGIYAEYRNVFWKKLVANAGVYVNYNTKFGWQAYPGIDLAYLFNSHWKLAACVGSGQRIPSFTDLYLNQLPGNIGNPKLQPENAWDYEANLQFHKKIFRMEVGYFYRDVQDFIDWVRVSPLEPYSPHNYGNIKIQGIHARIRQNFHFKHAQHLNYFINYNYLIPSYVAENNNQSKYVLETLQHQLLVGIQYGIKNFNIQLTNRFIQRMKNDPYSILDARISYKIHSFTVFGTITNSLDAQYSEAGAVPMPTRWISLGVRYRWDQK